MWYIIRKNFPCTIYCNLYFLDELFWIFGSKVLQKHLFSASGVLKKAQNRHKLKVFNPLHILGCFFWRLMMMLCCPSLCLSWTYGFQSKSTPKTPFWASEGLKRTHNRHKLWALNPLQPLKCFFWMALSFQSLYPWWSVKIKFQNKASKWRNKIKRQVEAPRGLKIYPNSDFLSLYN